jgi:hypothetical protein
MLKLRSLREHYRKDNDIWIPKTSFNSEEEIEKRLNSRIEFNYHSYQCGVCGKFHVATDWES